MLNDLDFETTKAGSYLKRLSQFRLNQMLGKSLYVPVIGAPLKLERHNDICLSESGRTLPL